MMNYSASGGIGEEGFSVVDSEAGKKITTHSFNYSSCNIIISLRLLMRAEPTTMWSSLKLKMCCKVCVHSSIIISQKNVEADKQRKSGNDSLTNEIRWSLSSNRSFESKRKNRKEWRRNLIISWISAALFRYLIYDQLVFVLLAWV